MGMIDTMKFWVVWKCSVFCLGGGAVLGAMCLFTELIMGNLHVGW